MIELYYWPTPNGWKISIALEEMGLEYETRFVNIGRGEQFEPAFLALSPNNRMPAIVDSEPSDQGPPLPVFESGAILVYLAEKSGRFLARDLRRRKQTLEWLFWQMAGLGPMLGQTHHFRGYAPRKIRYAIDRYTNEANRLYGVLDRRLEGREYIVDDYSIADMACWPWIVPHERQGQKLEEFPNLQRWYETMKQRPGVQRGFSLGLELRRSGMDQKARAVLFGQTAKTGRS